MNPLTSFTPVSSHPPTPGGGGARSPGSPAGSLPPSRLPSRPPSPGGTSDAALPPPLKEAGAGPSSSALAQS